MFDCLASYGESRPQPSDRSEGERLTWCSSAGSSHMLPSVVFICPPPVEPMKPLSGNGLSIRVSFQFPPVCAIVIVKNGANVGSR